MTSADLKVLGKKEYQISGVILTTIKCTPVNVEKFNELLPDFKSGKDRISMLHFLLLPTEKVKKIDFNNDVEIAEMNEVVDDFLYRSTGTSPAAMNSLIESIVQNPQILNSIPGLMDSFVNSESKISSQNQSADLTYKKKKK